MICLRLLKLLRKKTNQSYNEAMRYSDIDTYEEMNENIRTNLDLSRGDIQWKQFLYESNDVNYGGVWYVGLEIYIQIILFSMFV